MRQSVAANWIQVRVRRSVHEVLEKLREEMENRDAANALPGFVPMKLSLSDVIERTVNYNRKFCRPKKKKEVRTHVQS